MINPMVRTVVERFLKSKVPEVLAIKGAWGVGKTFAWNQLVVETKKDIGLSLYCYVSLFGMNSISDLRIAILAKTRDVKHLGAEPTAALKDWNVIRRVLDLRSVLREVPYAKHVSMGVELVAPHLISKTIVCLDDFERLGKGLLADEVLGFVSSLKEEKGCKVVLIFNEQKLGGNVETYTKYREKLVDFEVLYSPSPEQAAALVFDGSASWHAQAQGRSVALGITNIRLLRKISRLTADVFDRVQKLHKRVLDQAINTLVLVSWCYYEPDEDKPTMEFVRRFNTSMHAFEKYQAKKDGKEPDPKTTRWTEALEGYGFSNMDEFDLAIVKAVDQGYVEGTDLEAQARKLNSQFEAQDLDQSFTNAWKLFHDTFSDNQKELVPTLVASFKKSVQQISQLNLNGTVQLLRELGENGSADELIEYYIEARKDEPALFDMDSYPFSGDVADPKIRERFKAIHRTAHPVPSLHDAAMTMSLRQGFNNEDMAAMEAASEEDFYKLFKANDGEQHRHLVSGSVWAGGIGGHEELGKRVRAALERIASESPLNAIRVGKYLRRR